MRIPSRLDDRVRVYALAALAVAVVIGCASNDSITQPVASLKRFTVTNPFNRGGRTPFPEVGRNECVRAEVVKDTKGHPVEWREGVRNTGMSSKNGGDDGEWTMYGMFRFDELGRQTMEARCFLKTAPEARDIAKRFFESDGPRSKSGAGSVGVGPATIGAGTPCFAEYDAFGDWTGAIICGSELCEPSLMSLRLSTPGESSILDVVMSWTCSGGGSVVILGSGFAGYIPPDGSEPTPVVPPCTPGGGWVPPGDSVMDELRWGASLCSDSIDAICYPETPLVQPDTLCYRPLTPAESALVKAVRDSLMVPLHEIADTAARAACAAGWAGFDRMWASGRVYGAKFDSPSARQQGQRHEAAYDSLGRMHIETWQFTDAQLPLPQFPLNYRAELALSLVHEGLHEMGWPSHTTNEPFATPPWSYFNSMKHDRTYWSTAPAGFPLSPCVRWKTSP